MQVNENKIWDKVLLKLSRKAYSESEIEKDLAKKYQLEPSSIQKMIEKLKGYGFLNDSALQEAVVRSYTKRGYGKNRIDLVLKKRGLSIPSSFSQTESLNTAFLKAKKKYPEFQGDQKQRHKLIQFLMRRGFSIQHILEITKEDSKNSLPDEALF